METHISYDIAKGAAEIGFDEPCHGKWMEWLGDTRYFDTDEPVRNEQLKNGRYTEYAAPTVSQLQKWLMKEHDIHIVPHFVQSAGKYEPEIYTKNGETYEQAMMSTFTDYEGAISAWFPFVIEILQKDVHK